MSPAQLFYRRLRQEIRFQYGVFRMVGDWTVLVYLGIPALLAVVIWQVHLWWSIPSWMDFIPFPLFALLLYILFSQGSLRLYIQEADFLFLRQQEKWMKVIIHRGLFFSFLRDVVIVAVWFALAAPFLVLHYRISWPAVIVLFIFALLIKELLLYANNLLSLQFNGLFLKVLHFFVWIVAVVVFIVIATTFAYQLPWLITAVVIGAAVWIFFVKTRLQVKGSFLNDIEDEEQAKWKFASLVFMQALKKNKKTIFTRKRPYLFPKSGRVFRKETPAHRLADTYMKLFLRNSGMLRIYLGILGLANVFIIWAPVWLKWGGWVAILCLLAAWLRGHVKESEGHSFLHLWHWDPETKRNAAETSIYFLMLPNAVITGAVLGWFTFSWLGVPAVIFLAILMIRPIAQLFTPWYS